MPATVLAHQALVLPLKLRWPHRFSGLALCIGSMAPDLEFIWRMSDDWLFSHTLAAQFYFSLPVTLLLVWLITAVVLTGVLPFVRDHPGLRLHDLAALSPPQSAADWRRVALSGLLGGISHWMLDGITHGGHSGWAVPLLPWLRSAVPHPGGPVPLHDALQLWLTLLLGALSLAMLLWIVRNRRLWHWRAATPVPLPRRARHEGSRLLLALSLLAAQGAVVGHSLRDGGPAKLQLAGLVFGALDFALAGTLLFALWLAHRRRRI